MFQFKGGIQVYSADLLNALQSLYPEAEYQVFLKHDKESDGRFLPHTRFSFTGRWPRTVRTPVYAARLLLSALRHKPDLIIATHLHFSIIACWLKRITKTPYWVIAYGLEAWDTKRPGVRLGLRNADLVLAISNYTRERIIAEQKLDPHRVVLLPNALHPESFQVGPKPGYLLDRYNLKPTQPVILTVSRLAGARRFKGYDQVLQALPAIRRQIPEVRYIIAGKGDDRHRIEQLIDDLDLRSSVTLTGFVPDHELGDHYNLCDIFAMPSKKEGFGFVYLEALACGKPVIGGNQDGAVDALNRGELGVLVDPDNIEEIGQTIVQILQGRHAHPLIYQPDLLRQAAIDRFGFERFKHTLAGYLNAGSEVS